VEYWARPLIVDGEHKGAICTFNDITERRQGEAALRELNATLDQRVLDAIAEREAAEGALRQAQKMEAIGQLTGGVAHDFNNLLTVIRGSVDLLRRPDLTDERRRRYTDAIGETADRAAMLTSQLLAFARKQSLVPELFDAAESLRAIGGMVRTLVGSRIVVEIETAADHCFVRADRSQFDTALVNLAINARDAMNGEGALTLSIGRAIDIPAVRTHSAATGDYIAVEVRDTGSGITPDALARIFEPFFTTKPVARALACRR
jgi:signal transduction histidine kinase